MQNDPSSYLFIGRSSDIANKKDRIIYRTLEFLPGFFVWATLITVFVLSYLKPVWVSIFILAFAFYWILKVVYLALHTRTSYNRMRRYEQINWLEKLKYLPREQYHAPIANWRDIWQLVILPMYNESYDIVSAVFEALADTDWPKERMIVVLATEEAAGESAQETARKIEERFAKGFFKFFITRHPKGMPGEIPGKGSNETWAARRAKEFIDEQGISYEQILVSSLDADTVVYPRYFSVLAYHFLTAKNPYRASYQPVPLFINNIWEAPALSRVASFSSTFWHTMNQEREEKHITFSSHSMAFKTLVEVGFWQTNVVSEDSRIFWQCFLHYNGDYRVVSLYYPLAMDANVAHSYWRTMKNVYKQQRRWAFGAADIPYLIYGSYKNGHVPFRRLLQYGWPTTEGFYSWATHSLLLFILGWMPLFLGGDEFNTTLFSYNLPRMTRILLSAAMIGLISTAYLSIVLLPPRPPQYGRFKYVLIVVQWFLVPINLIIFGAFPAIEAQTRLMLGKYLGFWITEKFRHFQ